jgi:DNA-binding MarR family transcriptional regulator
MTPPSEHRLPLDLAVDEAPDGQEELSAKLTAALERIGHACRVLLRERGQAHGLSPLQAELLTRLAHEPAQRRRVNALAAELDVKPPTVSDAIGALRRKGLLASAAIAGDRRGQVLAPTPEGHSVAAGLAAWQTPVAEQLATVPHGVKADTLALLVDVIGGLQRGGAINVARTCTTCRFFRRDVHSGAAPHHCALLDSPLARADLRVDCAEHELVAA